MFYETKDPHGLAHNPFKSLVVPRPIGWISSRDRAGRVNLAPFSYFNAVADDPPTVMFSAGGPHREGGHKRDGTVGARDHVHAVAVGHGARPVPDADLAEVVRVARPAPHARGEKRVGRRPAGAEAKQLLVCARLEPDRARPHRELLVHKPSGGYPLYEFTTSPLTSGAHRFRKDHPEWKNPRRVPGTLVQERNFGVLKLTGPRADRGAQPVRAGGGTSRDQPRVGITALGRIPAVRVGEDRATEVE